MKMRIQGNSLRLRLKRPEVEILAAVGEVTSSIAFGAGSATRLEYVLASDAVAIGLRAEYGNHRIRVTIPAPWAREWAVSNRVGYEGEVALGGRDVLHILIEKDFKCIEEGADAEGEGTYPNPASHPC